ncbi:hypothetical protein ACQY0O_005222 [Thecaphora frezii]
MHKRWKQDPSVHTSWDVYFSSLAKGLPSKKAYHTLPTLMPIPMEALPVNVSGFCLAELVNNHLKVRGHHIACLNLLGILDPDLSPNVPEELKIKHYGWTKSDLDRKMHLGPGLLLNFVKAGIQTLTI